MNTRTVLVITAIIITMFAMAMIGIRLMIGDTP